VQARQAIDFAHLWRDYQRDRVRRAMRHEEPIELNDYVCPDNDLVADWVFILYSATKRPFSHIADSVKRGQRAGTRRLAELYRFVAVNSIELFTHNTPTRRLIRDRVNRAAQLGWPIFRHDRTEEKDEDEIFAFSPMLALWVEATRHFTRMTVEEVRAKVKHHFEDWWDR